MTPIEELYAWVCDGPDGGEVLPSVTVASMVIPLVSADAERAKLLRVHARTVAQARKQELRLVRCTDPQVVEVVQP